MFFYNPYEYETVSAKIIDNSFECEGIAFMDQTVIDEERQGVVTFSYANGSKVARNSVVALVYSDTTDVARVEETAEIDAAIKLLEDCQDRGVIEATDLEALTRQSKELQLQLIENLDNNRIPDAAALKNDINKVLNKRRIVVGQDSDFSGAIAELTAKRNSAHHQIQPPKALRTSVSGHFVNYTDGYEGIIKSKDAASISKNELSDMIETINPARNENLIGRMITSVDWSFAALVPNTHALGLRAGISEVSLNFWNLPDEYIKAKVTRIEYDHIGDSSLVVFSTDMMSGRIASLRKEKVEVILGRRSGISIPRSAYRIENGQPGVYIIYGNRIYFRKVDVIFENEEVVVSKINNETQTDRDTYVQQYDHVVIRGTDLSDGKRIK
ncbi:MAG: hypothetical protein FWH14_08175 [Oscillospiraceae bacterium]|nr:hypothetical protein [Oscillospiraceae bacterium]